MNTIHALNVGTRMDGNSHNYSDPKPDIYAARLGIAPINPAAQPLANEPADSLSCEAASIG